MSEEFEDQFGNEAEAEAIYKMREEHYMKHGLKEENYVAKYHVHCVEHCTVLAIPKGMPIIRRDKPCTNHKLDSWDDCWECYLESK